MKWTDLTKHLSRYLPVVMLTTALSLASCATKRDQAKWRAESYRLDKSDYGLDSLLSTRGLSLQVTERVTEYRPDSAWQMRPSSRRETETHIRLRDTTERIGIAERHQTETGVHEVRERIVRQTQAAPLNLSPYLLVGLVLSVLINVWLFRLRRRS